MLRLRSIIFFFFFSIYFLSVFISTCPAFSQNSRPPGEYLGADTAIQPVQLREFVVINDIFIVGNKITKAHIILRELPFAKNDSVRLIEIQQKLRSAKENLLNTSLFNFVTVDTLSAGTGRVNIMITVAERWYTWPVPVFEIQERNFNTWWQTKDLARANYGFYLERENFRGRKEDLSFYFQFGYTEKYGLTYRIPYLNKKQTSGAGFSFSYSRNHEVGYMTSDNKLLYFKDPTQYIREEFTGKLFYSYRRGIHKLHSIEAKFVHGIVNDTLNDYTTDYFIGQQTEMRFLSLDYFYRIDHRDSKIYPLKGYAIDMEATKLGLGIIPDEKIDITNLFLTLKGYHKLSDRFYLSGSAKVKFSPSKNQPYYVQRGLGWSDYVRGYEYYVIDGQSYGTTKLGLKYEIIKPRIQSIPHMPLKKFNTFHYALYAGIYGDVGYVDDRQYSLLNPLANTFLYGYGVGIDYVTYYDIVFRFEYSINRRLEHGFFVNFNAGI